MRSEKSAKKCKRGDPVRFFNVHSVAKYQKIEGGTLVQSKFFEESLIVPKNRSEKHQDSQRKDP